MYIFVMCTYSVRLRHLGEFLRKYFWEVYMTGYPPFVDREVELNILFDYAREGYYPVLYIYGPEGCGKTRLVREVVEVLKENDNYVVMYLDAQGSGALEEVIYPGDIAQAFSSLVGLLSEPLGKSLSLILPHVMKKVFERKVKDKHVVVVVDDVARPLGLDMIESYAKKLLDLLEWMLAKGARSVLIIATTSEGKSRKLLLRHNYVHVETLWNLSKEATFKLLDVLKAPSEIRELLWRVTGGNPRAIMELNWLKWNVEVWKEKVLRKVRVMVGELSDEEKSLLHDVIEDPDVLMEQESLLEKLMEYNLVTPIDRPCLGYTPELSKELGIGRFYAWQVPVYKEVLELFLK